MCAQRQIPHPSLLTVIPIHSNLKPLLQEIDTNEFSRDNLCRLLGELSFGEFELVGRCVQISGVLLFVGIHWSIGIGKEVPLMHIGVVAFEAACFQVAAHTLIKHPICGVNRTD